jgi:hypothetical protein
VKESTTRARIVLKSGIATNGSQHSPLSASDEDAIVRWLAEALVADFKAESSSMVGSPAGIDHDREAA